MSLYARLLGEDSLHEYGGIGGRVAGARLPMSVLAFKVKTPDQIEKAKRRAEKRAETRDYLRQVALGEGRRPLIVLGEAQLDAGKMKVMAKNLRKLYDAGNTTSRLHNADLFDYPTNFDRIIKQMDERGELRSSEVQSLKDIFKYVVDQLKHDPVLHKRAEAYMASIGRMGDLVKKEEEKDMAAARAAKKKKLNPEIIKKFSYVWFFKKGKEQSGKVMFVGPNKFKKGELTYGVKVVGEPKLVYISLSHIYEAKPPAPPFKKKYDDDDDGDFWVDAGKDMAAELGYSSPYQGFSKEAIKKHFGWK